MLNGGGGVGSDDRSWLLLSPALVMKLEVATQFQASFRFQESQVLPQFVIVVSVVVVVVVVVVDASTQDVVIP